MPNNNVYTNAKVVDNNEEVMNYELGAFTHNNQENQTPSMQNKAKLNENGINGNADPVLNEMKVLSQQIRDINSKMQSIQNNGMTGREIDAQVVQAIKDLKHYAAFFEQATFQMESKLLKTSFSIAKKIISIEVGENSATIAKQTISHLLEKIKTASKVQIHLNPKDYEVLKNDLKLEQFIELSQDVNVTPGGVVIASDLGNLDGNIESKVSSMLESLDTII